MFFLNTESISSWLSRRKRHDRKSKRAQSKGPVARRAANEVVNLPWGRISWCVSREIGNSNRLSVGRVLLHAGEEAPPHRHPNCEEVLHVVDGEIEHVVDEKVFTLGPGDTSVIPAGAWHQLRALGETDAQLVVCFSSANRVTEFGVRHDAGFDQQTIQ